MPIIDVKLENRAEFVRKFEERGFKIGKPFTKEEIINSKLPITLNYVTNEISRMGNVTCAAAAASCGAIVKEEEFWCG